MIFGPRTEHYIQAGNTDLSLQAEAGDSLLITGVFIDTPSSNYVTIETGNTTVGYARVGGTQGSHLPFPTGADPDVNLLSYLMGAGVFTGYPVPEGETFRISGAAQANALQAVTFIRGDAGEYSPGDQNGPDSQSYMFLNYGRPAAAASGGDDLYEESQTPAQFPAFPFGDVAPQGKTVRIHGIGLSDVGITSSSQSNQQGTEYLRLIRERVVLFDSERNGLLLRGSVSTSADETNVGEGESVIGNYTKEDLREPLLFDEPLRFESGEELLPILNTVVDAGSANFSLGDAEICLIESISPEGRR